MMSSGNLPPNAYQSLSSRVMRIPMRHTFTLDQKRILMKYFEQGMVGQSLMYQEKIQQCAQEASLEFDVVRNWIGNQRRKRRLEEVQRACMQNYIDHVPPGESNEGIPPTKMQTLTMAPPRQTQMLFLPHMAKQHGPGTTPPQQPLPGGTPVEGAVHSSETPPNPQHSEANQAQINQMALTQLVPTNQNVQQPSPQTQPPHTSPCLPNRSIPPYLQGQSSTGYPPVTANDGMQANSMPPQSTPPVQAPTSQRSNHSSPLGSVSSPVMSAASMQDEDIGFHQTPIRGFYPGPRGPRMMPGGAVPFPGHPQQRMSPPSFTVYPSVKMMPPPKESPEMRHHEIRRIVEQIQMNLDRLEQLGCESLLATVSTPDRSAYVCGTPIALQYFSKVNKDNPMAEYIHKQVSSDGDFDPDGLDSDSPNTDDVGLDEQEVNATSGGKQNDKHETPMGIGQPVQERVKLNPELTNEEEDDMDMIGDGEGIIKSGEEIYIVNKDRMVIGTGMLYPRPHDKMTFKNSPEYPE
ncbi:homeotic protein empty spiracles-like [Lytechinus pictus]|uniref:homeotic protein empty spiracles-like n=1 Tax=Lytechinus pictus TaxID=7653 RepID=UPI0030B9D2D2